MSVRERCGQGDIVVDMIKALEQAVEKVKELSAERQEYAAAVLEQIAEAGDGIYILTDEQRRLVREGLDQLDRGDVATDAEARAVFDKYRA
jgi:heterodisulfide reductase subunit C